MQRKLVEVNLDGLIGPSHHFGGLGVENKASEQSQFQTSTPKRAAIEGLRKMEKVAELGVPQFYLPPPVRPAWKWLESLGFQGSRKDILKRCYEENPRLLSAAYSSSFMWTANAATFAACCDTTSQMSLFKIANLSANLHRSIEATEREMQLQAMFLHTPEVRVLAPLFSSSPLRDEGAANVMRLCSGDGLNGVYVFVYGEDESAKQSATRRRKPRQTRLASELVAKSLELNSDDVILACQTTEAIDAGVFHNDVIATSHESFLLYHEFAFQESDQVIRSLEERFRAKTGQDLVSFRVSEADLPLGEAVDSYLFNSQIVTDRDGNWSMIAPVQCQRSLQVQQILRRLQAAVPRLVRMDFVSLDQSMANGGGPACLRLRANLTEEQIQSVRRTMRIGPETTENLIELIESRYPEKLNLPDLAQREFAEDCEEIARRFANLWGPNSVVSG